MSDSPLPDFVDARKIFATRGSVQGFVAPDRLQSLGGMLAEPDGHVLAQLDFHVDEGGRRTIQGCVDAVLKVVCQRCLEPLDIRIEEPINLVLVPDDTAAKQLGSSFDPWICQDQKIDLASLVGEQLILSLPIVSYHQDGPCHDQVSFSTERTERTERTESADIKAMIGNDIAADESDSLELKDNPFKILEGLIKP